MGKPWENGGLPSGKRSQNYVKAPFLFGKLATNCTWQLSVAMLNYQRVPMSIHMALIYGFNNRRYGSYYT